LNNKNVYEITTTTAATTTSTDDDNGNNVNCILQGIKFKVIGPPSSQDVIDACAKDAVRYQ